MTITIPDPLVPRVRAAWDGTFTREAGETDGQFFKRVVARYVKGVVVDYEASTAGKDAEAVARQQAQTDVTVT